MTEFIKDRKLAVIIVGIFLIALVIRLSIIDLRPLHHDEGVDAISFVKPLYDSGEYQYNPKAPYHGPFLYYANAVSFTIFGVNEFGLRFFGVLFSSLLVLFVYPLRKYLGYFGSIAAAFFIVLSPIFVHYSTYSSSHELPFLLFELSIVVFFFLFYESRERKYLYAGVVSIGLLFTTKETAYAAMLLFFLSFLGVIACTKTKKTYFASIKNNIRQVVSLVLTYRKDVIASVLIAFFVFAVFYTSFFKYPNNLLPTVTDTLPYMLSFSQVYKGHEKPFLYYTDLFWKYDIALLAFTLIGLSYFRKNIFVRFIAFLSVLTWLSFSYVDYKTPWLVLHIMLPMVFVAGIGAQEIYRKIGKYAILIMVIVFVYTTWISYNTNYIEHSGQFNQLAYVTTTPELVDVVNRIYTFNKSAEIKVLSPEHWPLPWYLRDYKRVGYYGQIIDKPDADVVIVKKEDKEKLQGNLTGTYDIRDYQLRYGVWLTAFYRV